MKLDIYVNYPGNCKQAFEFYQQHLGGKIITMMTHGENPETSNVPDDWKDAVLNASMEIGGIIVMAADIPHAEPMRSAYLTLHLSTVEEAENIYAILSTGGQIFMKMEETFFAKRFAMLRDKFGTSWMLLCDRLPA